MPQMRSLLVADPSIPPALREAISRGDASARSGLVRLGLNDCEAAELLDQPPDETWPCD